jgi:hypothetical protein
VGETVSVRRLNGTLDVFQGNDLVASHAVGEKPYRHTTVAEHMWSHGRPGKTPMEWHRVMRRAAELGRGVEAVIHRNLESRPHPEQAYRTCDAILGLGRTYGAMRLEAACQRALTIARAQAISSATVRRILEEGLDRPFRERRSR